VCTERNLPTKWSATDNVRWRGALPEPGNSTPIVWGDRIFLTQGLDGGIASVWEEVAVGILAFRNDFAIIPPSILTRWCSHG
jgi:hypothetical protein